MLKKLSLAALVAMGSMSVASATPLTDAIKGVNLNGFLRIRYYYHQDDNGAATDYNRWRTNAKLIFNVPVAENTKIVWRVNAQTNVKEKATSTVSTAGTTGLTDSLFYLNYANNGLVVNVGVVPLAALPYASSDSFTTAYGAGAVALYKVQDGLTVAGGFVDHIFNAENDPNPAADIYTAAIIYSNDAIGKVQIWDYAVTNVIDNAAMIMTNLNLLKDYGVGLKADYATSELDDNLAKKLTGKGADNHDYYKVALTANVSGVDAEIGYAGTNDKVGVIATSDDAKIGMIPTELRYNVANLTDSDTVYAKLGYKLNEKTKVWASYANISADEGDSNEYNIGSSYKVNKKFGISGYYAYLDMDQKGATDKQEVRVELKYSF